MLNALVRKLDKRRAKESKGKGSFQAKERVRGLPSLQAVPPDAPRWAVKSQYTLSASTPSPSEATSTAPATQTPTSSRIASARSLMYKSAADELSSSSDSDSESDDMC